MKPVQQFKGETEPKQSSPESHNGPLNNLQEVFQDLSSDQQNVIFLSTESLEMNSISGPLSPISFLGSCRREQSSKSNMASTSVQGQPMEEIASEIRMASTSPLQALRSLCSSISSENISAQASGDVLATENHLENTKLSRFDLSDRGYQGAMPNQATSETSLSSAVVPPSLLQETRGLWRPWVYDRGT